MPHRFIVTTAIALLALGSLGAAAPAALAQGSRPGADELQMPQDAAPFRAARAEGTPGRSATVTRTSDAAGNNGFAFYLWAAMADGAVKPFTLYIVDEGGRLAVANVVPDRLVEGRHR